ncbi:MAG: squalene/phytoene synthase family protein [Rhodobacterales bacterium]|nr:squalene/phytoene synthase family protein [Rhodobacterales bacterium]
METDDINICAAQVERADPDRFMAAMAAPPKARDVLFPLYAFNVEISRAPWVTKEPMIAQMRLQYWRDILDEIRGDKAPRPHEVATPLAGLIGSDDAELLDQLIVARHWDIHSDPFDNQDAFDDYIAKTSGNLMLVAARLLGAADAQTVHDFAYGTGVANYLRATPALAAAGRVPLLDGRPEAIQELAHGALLRLQKARKNRKGIAPNARAALLSGWHSAALLKQVIAAPQRVADGAIGLSEFSRKMRLMAVSVTGRW